MDHPPPAARRLGEARRQGVSFVAAVARHESHEQGVEFVSLDDGHRAGQAPHGARGETRVLDERQRPLRRVARASQGLTLRIHSFFCSSSSSLIMTVEHVRM